VKLRFHGPDRDPGHGGDFLVREPLDVRKEHQPARIGVDAEKRALQDLPHLPAFGEPVRTALLGGRRLEGQVVPLDRLRVGNLARRAGRPLTDPVQAPVCRDLEQPRGERRFLPEPVEIPVGGEKHFLCDVQRLLPVGEHPGAERVYPILVRPDDGVERPRFPLPERLEQQVHRPGASRFRIHADS
jgi:hypothetical protein